VQFYASGTVQMTALTSNATDTFSVLAGAYLTLTPVSN
jgi:hypothetical protein